MTMAFIWKYKSWLLLAAVIIAAVIVVAWMEIDIASKSAKLSIQKSQIETLTRQNEIMTQNAAAAAKAQKQSQIIQEQAEPLREMAESLPQKAKDCLGDEEMDRVNDCLGAFFRDGVLPKTCNGAAFLPKATATAVESGRQ